MERTYFLQTTRLGFSRWTAADLPLAAQLWGNPEVTRYICASGVFTSADIEARLNTEIQNDQEYGVQYWPVFLRESGTLVGCCGLRPRSQGVWELGFHLLPQFWGTGCAAEAARAVMDYAFTELHARELFAGHNPKNFRSRSRLLSLGFVWIKAEYYAPTGLMHPSYRLGREDYEANRRNCFC